APAASSLSLQSMRLIRARKLSAPPPSMLRTAGGCRTHWHAHLKRRTGPEAAAMDSGAPALPACALAVRIGRGREANIPLACPANLKGASEFRVMSPLRCAVEDRR